MVQLVGLQNIKRRQVILLQNALYLQPHLDPLSQIGLFSYPLHEKLIQNLVVIKSPPTAPPRGVKAPPGQHPKGVKSPPPGVVPPRPAAPPGVVPPRPAARGKSPPVHPDRAPPPLDQEDRPAELETQDSLHIGPDVHCRCLTPEEAGC